MDKFNFAQVAQSMKIVERKFLEEGIKLAQNEMKENFESESSKESGLWEDLSYRNVPPPILDLTGEMKNEALTNQPIISGNTATLIIDPIDPIKGKGYASYHEQGEEDVSYGKNIKREFITQSNELTEKQVNLLVEELDKVFR